MQLQKKDCDLTFQIKGSEVKKLGLLKLNKILR